MTLRPSTDEFDRALRAATRGDVIELGCGLFTTSGNWASSATWGWVNVPPGVRIVGAGPGRSIIQLSPAAERAPGGVVRPDRDVNVLWTGDDVQICGVTIDGNERAFRASGASLPWYPGGIHRHGSLVLEDVDVIGLRGAWRDSTTQTIEIERFALSGGGDVSRCRVVRVRVYECAENSYVSGLMLGGSPDRVGRGLVADCVVDLGRGNQFGFAAQHGVTFSRCVARGVRNAVYNDDGPTRDIEVLDSHLVGEWAGIGLISKGPDAVRSVVVRGGTITAPRLVEVVQRPGGSTQADVLVSGARFSGLYVAAVDNPAPCSVRVEGCILPDDAQAFHTRRSPSPITRSNVRPNGQAHPDAIKTLTQ